MYKNFNLGNIDLEQERFLDMLNIENCKIFQNQCLVNQIAFRLCYKISLYLLKYHSQRGLSFNPYK